MKIRKKKDNAQEVTSLESEVKPKGELHHPLAEHRNRTRQYLTTNETFIVKCAHVHNHCRFLMHCQVREFTPTDKEGNPVTAITSTCKGSRWSDCKVYQRLQAEIRQAGGRDRDDIKGLNELEDEEFAVTAERE